MTLEKHIFYERKTYNNFIKRILHDFIKKNTHRGNLVLKNENSNIIFKNKLLLLLTR